MEAIEAEKGPPACFTFFVPPNDGTDEENKELLRKIHATAKFRKSGSLLITNESDDMFRKGGQFPVFHLEENEAALRYLTSGRAGTSPYLELDFLGPTADTFQGLYRQIHKFEFEDTGVRDSQDTACVLMAFKSMQPQPDPELVLNWKSWTGARGLIVDFGTDLAAQKVAFYVREEPQLFDVFMYVVLMHVFVSGEAWNTVRHLMQRFRVERQFGYISVYKTTAAASPAGGR